MWSKSVQPESHLGTDVNLSLVTLCEMFLELPGLHVCVLQLSVKELDPWQVFPPQEGAGLLQLLDRDLVPVPHDLLQVDQPAQDPHLPLTVKATS